MNSMRTRALAVITALGLLPATAAGQDFAATGTRAAGMGGAFVGVADDATALYWNPAGLALGAYFSSVLDFGSTQATPDGLTGRKGSSMFLGLSMPALGLGYYRLHVRQVNPSGLLTANGEVDTSRELSVVDQVRVDTLTTHHAGVTVVQSLYTGVAVGATLKFVRGIASSLPLPPQPSEQSLNLEDIGRAGTASNTVDMDLGVMATGGPLKVGVTMRNLRAPTFTSTAGSPGLRLDRQVRAGLSYAFTPAWLAAADVDLLASSDAFGERRDVALGVEGRVARGAFVRSGLRLNTISGDRFQDARALTYSVGASYAISGSAFVDGHLSAGGDRTGLAWGLAARFVY